MNVELPSDTRCGYAPEKSAAQIKQGLAVTRARIERSAMRRERSGRDRPRPAAALRAGRTVNADDRRRRRCERSCRSSCQRVALCESYGSKRVYYSAFSPTGHPSANLPQVPTPLCASTGCIRPTGCCASTALRWRISKQRRPYGMLDLTIDPKLAWALQASRAIFPSTSTRGARAAVARAGLGRAPSIALSPRVAPAPCGLTTSPGFPARARARPFIVTADYRPGRSLDDAHLRQRLCRAEQLSFRLTAMYAELCRPMPMRRNFAQLRGVVLRWLSPSR